MTIINKHEITKETKEVRTERSNNEQANKVTTMIRHDKFPLHSYGTRAHYTQCCQGSTLTMYACTLRTAHGDGDYSHCGSYGGVSGSGVRKPPDTPPPFSQSSQRIR